MKTKLIKISLIFIGVFMSSGLSAQNNNCFTDNRDGHIYKTIKIGTQIWMAENLAFKTDSGSMLYNNDDKNLKFGYLYNLEVIPHMNICPKGWRLPAEEDWNELIEALGGEIKAGAILKNKVGFNTLFPGVGYWRKDYGDKSFSDFGECTVFCSSTTYKSYESGLMGTVVYVLYSDTSKYVDKHKNKYADRNKNEIYRKGYYPFYYVSARCIKK